MDSLDFEYISTFLQSTIIGILILGALGSILGALFLFILKRVIRKIVTFMRKHLPDKVSSVVYSYGRLYLRKRSVVLQLRNKGKYAELLFYYNDISNNSRAAGNAAFLSLSIVILLLSFTGTIYLKTLIFFIAITFICVHDWLVYGVVTNRIGKYLYGDELDLAKRSYLDNEAVSIEFELSYGKDEK